MRYMPQHNHTNRFGYQPSAGARTARHACESLSCGAASLTPTPRCAAELMARLTPLRRTLLTDLCHPLGVGTRKVGERSRHSATQPGGWKAEQVPPVSDPYASRL